MSLMGKAKASSRRLGRETQRLPATEQGSPQSTHGPVAVARPWRLRASPRAPPTTRRPRETRGPAPPGRCALRLAPAQRGDASAAWTPAAARACAWASPR